MSNFSNWRAKNTKITSASDGTKRFSEWRTKKAEADKLGVSTKEYDDLLKKKATVREKYSGFLNKYNSFFKTSQDTLSRESNNGARWKWDASSEALQADRATNSLKSEAQELLNALEADRKYMTDEGYTAYKEFLTGVSKGDYKDLTDALKGEAVLREQVGSAENYKKLLTEAERRKEYEGYTYSQLKDKADILKSTGNKEKADWVSSFAKTVMTGEDYDAEIKAIDNEIAELESALDQYKDAKITMRTGDYTQQWFREWGAKYGSKKEIRARISQLEKERKDLEGGKTYTQMLSEANADKDYDSFVEKGKIKGAPYQDLNAPTASKISGLRSGTDDRYVSVRDNEGAIDDIEHIAAENMTEEEHNLYLYFLGKYGENKANELLDAMSSSLYLRNEQKYNQKLTAFAKENPFIASALSVPASLFSGVEYIKDLPQYVTEDTAPRNQTSSLVSTIRGAVSEDVHINIGKWDAGSFVYNTAMSGADSLAAGLTGYAGGVILGLSAAASATNEAVERGLSKEDAFFSGVTAGVFEGLFESVSIGNLKSFKTLPEKTLKGYAKNIAKSMLVNASEETLTEIANITYDIIYNGDLSNYEIAVQMYIDKGFSEEEARSKAATDLVVQVAEAGASGALMGFGFGAVGSVSNAASHTIESTREKTDAGRELLGLHGGAEALANEVMNELELDRATYEKLFGRAEKLSQSQAKKNGKYSGRTARLAERVQREAFSAAREVGTRSRADIIKNKLEGKGVSTEKSAEIASEINSSLRNEEALEALTSKYSGNDAVLSAISELTDTENENHDSSLFDSAESESRAIMALAMGRERAKAHFDTDYSDESGRIDEETAELGEIVRFEETKNEEGATVSTPVIKVDDREIPTSEIDLKADSIYSNVEGMDITLANEMISAYKAYGGNVSAESFASDWKMAYQMGLANRGAEHSDFKSYGFKISPEAAEAARALGQDEFNGNTESRKAEIKQAQKKKTGREGTISTERVKNKSLVTEGARQIAKVLSIAGYNVEFFEDYSEQADRGSYHYSSNTIRINVAVGTGRGGIDHVLGRTLSHELTHSIQRWNPDGYEELKSYVIEKMGDGFEGMVYRRMKQLKLDRADAIDEVVAYSCEMMLRDSKALGDFAKEHRTLFEKICDIVEEFIKKIRAALPALYDNIGPESQEARFMDLYLTDLQTVFDKALSDALKASEATVDHTLQSNANKKAAEDGGKVQYSKGERTFSYDELVSKDDLQVVSSEYGESSVLNNDKTINNEFILKTVRKKCDIIKTNSKEPTYYTFAPDINRNVEIVRNGIEHGYIKGKRTDGNSATPKDILNARIAISIPEIIRNSIEVNRSTKDTKLDKPYSHVMIGVTSLKDIDGNTSYYAVRTVIEEKTNRSAVLTEYNILGFLHAVNAKKISPFKGRDTKNSSALTTGDLFKYSIADLLNDVKSEFDDTFSEDVYTHLNMKRRQTEHFSDHLQYSRGEGYDPYKEYKYPSYAMMPEFVEPLNVNYTGEGYTAENGLKLFTKYSVDTARDFIMGELMLSEGKISLAKDLNEFYTFIATAKNLTWEDIEERAGAIADKLLTSREEKIARDPRAQEALDTIRGARITFDEKQKADAKALSGSFGKYRQSLMGRVNIVNGGISLDSIWQEWASEFPEYFSADTNSNDMPRALLENIEKLKNSRAGDGFNLSEEEERERAIQLIYDSFRRVATESVSQEAYLYGKKRVYGDTLIDSLERTVQTQEDKAIIDSYRSIEADVSRKRTELAGINNDINSLLFTPEDRSQSAKLTGLREDVKAIKNEIRELERGVKQARDRITVTEHVISDKSSTDSARTKALAEITKDRQALARLERELSAKKTSLSEKEREIGNMRDPRINALSELHKTAADLRREISEADASLFEMRSTKRFKTLLARERAQAIRDTKSLMYRRQAESRTRQENTHLRQRIWKEMQKLEKLLSSGTVGKHVPSDMISTVAALSQAVPGRDVDYDAKIASLEPQLENLTGKEYREAQEKLNKYRFMKEYASRTTEALEEVFSSLSEDSPIFDEEVYNDVQDLSKEIRGRSINELENHELSRLLDVINEVKAAIKNADRVFGEKRSLYALGMEGTEEVLANNKEISRSERAQKLHDAVAKFGYSMLKPYELFEMTGSKVLYERFRKLQAREGTYYSDIDEASGFYKEVAKKNGITSRQLKEKYSYKTADGREIALSVDEIMSIYLMSHRAQAMLHLTSPAGGFRFAGGYTVETKKAEAAKTTDEKLKAVKYAYKQTSEPVRLTEGDVYAISRLLTDEQKAFADSIQKFMAGNLGDKGNEVSTALYDVKKFTDPDYFPIHTDAGYRLLSIEKAAGEIQLKNLGFTKDLKYKASGPLVLESMTQVFARHANEMSLYHAFALELENMKRVLNYSTDEDPGGGMKAALGEAMTAEIVDFIKSVNGGVRSDNINIADKLISLNKGARVGASLSVAIQQPSAIIRAFSMIDPKYFTGLPGMKKADIRRDGKIWEEMKKYTSTTGIKELGGVDVNTSRGITEQLTDLHWTDRTAGTNVYKGIQRAAYILPETGDRVAWSLLWTACKREAAQTFRGEAILIEAGRRFDEIVNRTQVYDSVFSRSKIMRSQNTFAKMVTAFMAEPMTTANMIIQAARDISSKDPRRTKAGLRSIGAVSASIIINNALVSIIYAMRDDDEDESYIEKYTESFLQKMETDLNFFSYIPLGKDILSLVQGYDVERMDMSLISDIVDSAQALVKLWDNDDTTAEDWIEGWTSFGTRILDFAGIPVSNAVREYHAVANFVNTLKVETTAQGYKEALLDGVFEDAIILKKNAPSALDADKLYRAIKSGDSARFKQITKRLGNEGKTLKQIQSLIVSGLKENDKRITAAAEAKNAGDLSEYNKIVDEITKDGFASSYVASAVQSVVSKMNREAPEENEYGTPDPEENAPYTSIYSADDIIINLEAGDTAEAQIAIDDIFANKYAKAISELKDNENEDDAEKSAYQSLRSMISADYRPLYKAGDSAERERIKELLLEIHVNGEQLYKKSTIEGWGEED